MSAVETNGSERKGKQMQESWRDDEEWKVSRVEVGFCLVSVCVHM